jgi:nucleoside-diphosphate-sugar epimerase
MNGKKVLVTGGSGFIGSNIILALEKENYEILNVDKARPCISAHSKYWANVNILDKQRLADVFCEFKPEIVIHLAAKTDTSSDNLEDYVENTTGTRNVLDAIKSCGSVLHVVVTSSQYVYFSKSGGIPDNDTDFAPHTAYGQSKVITEELTRQGGIECCWTIIRPTNVWGPWNMRYPNELLKMIDMGLYVQPGRKKVRKSYAYVKNLVFQVMKIISSNRDLVNHQVFYLGEFPMDSYEWVNTFSLQLRNKSIIIVPSFMIHALALIGDFARLFRVKFPLTSLRYKNMTTDYLTPMEKTINLLGLLNESHSENVRETINWLRGEGMAFFPYWKKRIF